MPRTCAVRARPLPPPSMRLSALAARRTSRWRSGTSRPRASRSGARCRRSSPRLKRPSGVDVGANTYAYPAWFNSTSAFIPPWAHDGGDKKMIERLKDPAMRARIRKELLTPNATWENEWQEVPGPEAILIAVVANQRLLPLQGKTLAQIAQERGKAPNELLLVTP